MYRDTDEPFSLTSALLGPSRSHGGSSAEGGGRRKWVPPSGGWEDTLPPEPRAPPTHRTRQVTTELDQLHALGQSKSQNPPGPSSGNTRRGVVALAMPDALMFAV